ncbi:MAG: hypothetical protein R3C26_18625 [Calditrichia bacterium]
MKKALKRAQREKTVWSLILLRTHIGYGSPNMQDTSEVRSPLGEDEETDQKNITAGG